MVTSEEISKMLKAKKEGKVSKKEETEEGMKKCPECGTGNKEDAKFCVGCGESFPEKELQIKSEDTGKTKNCPQCKSEIPEKAKFCVVCGETQTEDMEEPVEEEAQEVETSDEPLIENVETEVEAPSLTVQELTLNHDGLKLTPILKIQGMETDLIKFEDIESIELKDGTLIMDTAQGEVKIMGMDPDSGSAFASYAQEMVDRAKPQLDPESMDKIEKAKELLDAGLIDEEEFDKIKRKIVEKE